MVLLLQHIQKSNAVFLPKVQVICLARLRSTPHPLCPGHSITLRFSSWGAPSLLGPLPHSFSTPVVLDLKARGVRASTEAQEAGRPSNRAQIITPNIMCGTVRLKRCSFSSLFSGCFEIHFYLQTVLLFFSPCSPSLILALIIFRKLCLILRRFPG